MVTRDYAYTWCTLIRPSSFLVVTVHFTEIRDKYIGKKGALGLREAGAGNP